MNLTLTADKDPQLPALTECMRQETSGWYRMATLMIRLGQFNKAEELCQVLLNQAFDNRAIGFIYHQLEVIRNDQGDYAKQFSFIKNDLKLIKIFFFQIIFSWLLLTAT